VHGESWNAYKMLVRKLEGKRCHHENKSLGWLIILRWILEGQDVVVLTALICFRIETNGGGGCSCKYGNEPSKS
jgi:hypothetical protein